MKRQWCHSVQRCAVVLWWAVDDQAATRLTRRRAVLVWDACEWDASRGMMLYRKVDGDITARSQAERLREGHFQYGRVRVFFWGGLGRGEGGGLSGRGSLGLFALSSLHLLSEDKRKKKQKKNKQQIKTKSCSFDTRTAETKEAFFFFFLNPRPIMCRARRIWRRLNYFSPNARTFFFPSPSGIISFIHLVKKPWKMSEAFEVEEKQKH